MGDCLLESGDFCKGGVRELEFKVFRLFAIPRPDKITNFDQPCSAIDKSRSGDLALGDGEREGDIAGRIWSMISVGES